MRVLSGIEGFDSLVGGGLPEGASIVLRGPSGNEKDTFALQFLAQGLRSGGAAVVVVSSSSPEQYLESLSRLGVDVREAAAGNRLKVVDWHSYQEESIAGVEERDHVFRCSVDLTNVGIALSRALATLAPGVSKRAVLEILSPALQVFELGAVYAFAQSSKAKLARHDVTALYLLEKEMHDPATVSSVSQPFDGVIEIDRRREGDAIVRKIGVLSMKDTVPDPSFRTFALLAETGIRVQWGPGVPRPAAAGRTPAPPSAAERVLRIAEERLRVDPADADALFAKASALATIGEVESAVAALDALSTISDTYPGLWVLRAKLAAKLGDADGARRSRQKAEEVVRREEERLRTAEAVPCPICEAPVPVDAHQCSSCGATLIEEAGLADELDSLGKAAIHERVQEELKGEPEAPRKRPGPVPGRVAPPKAPVRREAGGRRGMTNGLAREGLKGPVGRTNGLTNGLRGRTNGLTNGLRGRTNGLTNGLKGRTNGLTNGLRGRTNGLTNGLRGRTNGLTNGLKGRTNGLTNGLTAMRRGMTNGLTNGNGFTNGLGAQRFSRETQRDRWKLLLIPAVVILLLAAPVLNPGGPARAGIAIDGDFADWNGVPTVPLASTAGNPNVALTQVAFVNQTNALSLMIGVQGQMLAGGPAPQNLMDTVFVFVDNDRRADTGYRIHGLGADRLLKIEGRGGAVRVSTSYHAPPSGGDPRDWQIWTDPAPIDAAANGSRLELAVDWLFLSETGTAPVFLIATLGWDGTTDFADLLVGAQPGLVRATQYHVQPTILSGANVPLLAVDLSVRDSAPVTVSGLTIELLGTAPLANVGTLTLVNDTGATIAQRMAVGPGRTVTFAFTELLEPTRPENWTLIAAVSGSGGETLGAGIPSPYAVSAGTAVVTLVNATGAEPLGYVGRVPAGRVVDGAFAEWTDDAADGANEASTRGNPSVDVDRFRGEFGPSDLAFHLALRGPAFAGTVLTTRPSPAPTGPWGSPDRDRDTVPDSIDPMPDDFNNDGIPDGQSSGDVDGDGSTDYLYGGADPWLNTTIPLSFPAPYAGRNVTVYAGPTSLPPAIGEDRMRLFVDPDNVTATGFYVGGIGADYLVEMRGRDGDVSDGSLYRHSGGPTAWQWTRVGGVTFAMGILELEVRAAITPLVPFPSMYLETSDWSGSNDTFGPSTRGAGTRSAPVFTGPGPAFVPASGGEFAYRSTGTQLEAYVRSARGADDELVLRHGSLFIGWRTERLGGSTGIGLAPGAADAEVAGRNLVLGGFLDAWEEYEIGVDRIKHNLWLLNAPSTTGDRIALSGELRIPAGATVLVNDRATSGPFTTDGAIVIEYDGYRIRLQPPFAFESRHPATTVAGLYEGDAQNTTVRLSMSIPSTWLQSPARTFPVVLDPSGIIDTSTSSAATHGPYGRNVFYDGTNFWAFYYDGTTIQYEPSSDGLSWVNTKNAAFTTASVARVSVWFHDAGGTKIVYVAGDDDGATKVTLVRRGTISGATITWGTEGSVTVSAINEYKRPSIARDSGGYLWIVANDKEGGGSWNFVAVRSTASDNVATWGTYTTLLSASIGSTDIQGVVVPLGGSDMYAIWYANGNIEGKKYTSATSSWGSLDSIDTTSTATLAKAPSATVDASFNIHLVYTDSTGLVKYRQRTSSWSAATTLDSNSGNTYPTITKETGSGDLYALWISSTNQMKAKRYSGSWTDVTLETSTLTKSALTSVYNVSGLANMAWSWTQGSAPPYDVKFSVYSTTLVSRTIDTSTDSQPVDYNHQRKVFHDGTYFWAFYYDGTDSVYTYSSDGHVWENPVSRAFSTSSLDSPSVWYHDTGSTKIVYAVADGTGTDSSVVVRRGTIGGTVITWGTEATPTVSSSNLASKIPFITRDSSGYLWIASNEAATPITYNAAVIRSTAADNVATWGALTALIGTSLSVNRIYPTILPQSGGNMYAFWYANGLIAGKPYTGSWGSQEGIASTTSGVATKIPSGVVDASDNVNLVFSDSTGAIVYRQRTTSWGTNATLDSGSGSTSPTITLESGTGDLYVYYLSSTSQIKGQRYSGGGWASTTTGIDTSTITKAFITSVYSVSAASGVAWLWDQGTSTPYEVKVAKIPEFGEVVVPIAGTVLILLGLRAWRRRGWRTSVTGVRISDEVT